MNQGFVHTEAWVSEDGEYRECSTEYLNMSRTLYFGVRHFKMHCKNGQFTSVEDSSVCRAAVRVREYVWVKMINTQVSKFTLKIEIYVCLFSDFCCCMLYFVISPWFYQYTKIWNSPTTRLIHSYIFKTRTRALFYKESYPILRQIVIVFPIFQHWVTPTICRKILCKTGPSRLSVSHFTMHWCQIRI